MNSEVGLKIKEIIRRSFEKCDAPLADALENVLCHLGKHQDDFLRELSCRLHMEQRAALANWDEDFVVITKLANIDELADCKRDGYMPIQSANLREDCITGAFLNVPYEDIGGFCNKAYHGICKDKNGNQHDFAYVLSRDYSLVEAEKDLFEIADVYELQKPVIFSPYARRQVRIEFYQLDAALAELIGKNLSSGAWENPDGLYGINDCVLDFQLKENELENYLLLNKILLWNVDIKEDRITRDMPPVLGADGNIVRYEYLMEFDKEQCVFVLPEEKSDDIVRQEDKSGEDENKRLIIRYSSPIRQRSCKIVTLRKCTADDADSDMVFANYFFKEKSKLRLRTRGDIEYILSSFNKTYFGKKFAAEYVGLGTLAAKNKTASHKMIFQYNRQDSYKMAEDALCLSLAMNKPVINLLFAGEGLLKTDYVNYVLHYLKKNYPEFNWAGVEA